MTTKTTKAAKASKKTLVRHIAIPGKGTSICGKKGLVGNAEDASCSECIKIADHAAEKAKNEAKATAATEKADQPEVKKAPRQAAEPRERDPRLPPPGTVLKKLDRSGAVRCECKVTETGFRYNGEDYRSLSAAAMAAAKDLGIAGSQNGFLFWGIIKQQQRIADPVAALEAVWKRYHERVKAIVGSDPEHSTRVKVFNVLEHQAREIADLSKSL